MRHSWQCVLLVGVLFHTTGLLPWFKVDKISVLCESWGFFRWRLVHEKAIPRRRTYSMLCIHSMYETQTAYRNNVPRYHLPPYDPPPQAMTAKVSKQLFGSVPNSPAHTTAQIGALGTPDLGSVLLSSPNTAWHSICPILTAAVVEGAFDPDNWYSPTSADRPPPRSPKVRRSAKPVLHSSALCQVKRGKSWGG